MRKQATTDSKPIRESQGDTVLEVRDLKVHFFTEDGVVKAVDGVDFDVPRGKVLGVVGESGCGKSVTALSILQLIPRPGRIVDGSILYEGSKSGVLDIAALAPEGRKMHDIRGNDIAMVFQEPMTSLTPVYTIGKQITEALAIHTDLDSGHARDRAVQLLGDVGMPDPDQRVDQYPFELSGGMRQRALIAMALACDPKLLIADEPTTALDVTIQAQILRLLRKLQRERDMSIMMITHDLGVVAEIADNVVVMYLGKIVERGSVRQIFKDPRHPYTVGLMRSVPRIGDQSRLEAIRGVVPTPFNLPEGCPFADRCPHVMPKCSTLPPEIVIDDGHTARCWLYEDHLNEEGGYGK